MLDIMFRINRRKWIDLLLNRIGGVISERERKMLIESCRKAKTKESWLHQVVAFAQDLEMSAGLARMHNKLEDYKIRLQTAAKSYAFVQQFTSDTSLQQRMRKAEDEIIKRLNSISFSNGLE